jgi:catechol 2,3-dioxygenase-like lactoylglutathione lyase family enzyme
MKHLYPIVATPALKECKDFYVRLLNARVMFQKEWYLHLSIDNWEIGFLHPMQPTRLPMFRHATLTRGLCLALEVRDVATTHQEFIDKGIEILGRLETFPSGENGFSVMDPAGIVLNIVERHPDDMPAMFEI